MNDASSADERPVRRAVTPAIINEKMTAGPANPAATPKVPKLPYQ